jgi:hypothetical protein
MNSDKGQAEIVENILSALARYKEQVEGGVPLPADIAPTDTLHK